MAADPALRVVMVLEGAALLVQQRRLHQCLVGRNDQCIGARGTELTATRRLYLTVLGGDSFADVVKSKRNKVRLYILATST